MATDQSIGLMDGAYFVGRKDVLDWINNTLGLNLAKIEQTASGAVACQLLDSMYPGTVAMHKVSWEAKVDYEFVQNYKVLQSGFNKHKINRHIEVDKLVRAKYQDNLEFMQWFKRFYELNSTFDSEYDAQAVRAKGKGGKKANTEASKKRVPVKKAESRARPVPRATTEKSSATRSTATRGPSQKENVGANKANAEQNAQLQGKVSELEGQRGELENETAQLKMTLEGLEKERDFYFGKLRDIEILCQGEPEDNDFVQRIFKILYATEDDFVAVDADDEKNGQDVENGAKPEDAIAAAEAEGEDSAPAEVDPSTVEVDVNDD